MRVVVALVTAVVSLGMGTICLLTLLVTLNGFSESAATPGLGIFGVLGLVAVSAASILGVVSFNRLAASGQRSRGVAGTLAVLMALGLMLVVLGIIFVIVLVVTSAM